MIWIFGDSFSSNNSQDSWTEMLSRYYSVKNFSSNGSSEYRIWKNYQKVKHSIANDDIVIFCHTSQSRIFLKDSATLLSRMLGSHSQCDLIINDVFGKKESKFVKILRTIWDDEFFNDTYLLYANDLMKVPNSIHFTFFDSDTVESYKDIWVANKGTINHMDLQGNQQVFERIKGKLDV